MNLSFFDVSYNHLTSSIRIDCPPFISSNGISKREKDKNNGSTALAEIGLENLHVTLDPPARDFGKKSFPGGIGPYRVGIRPYRVRMGPYGVRIGPVSGRYRSVSGRYRSVSGRHRSVYGGFGFVLKICSPPGRT